MTVKIIKNKRDFLLFEFKKKNFNFNNIGKQNGKNNLLDMKTKTSVCDDFLVLQKNIRVQIHCQKN